MDAIQEKSGSCQLRTRSRRFVELFRTTPPKTVCPNFYVLAHANGCTFSPRCSYCYLESTFWSLKEPQAFTNLDKVELEIRSWIKLNNLETNILNTGNLSDSLSFEEQRPLMARLVEVFREEAEAKGRPHSLLIVTKGAQESCQAFLAARPCANIIVSFSVNSAEAARKYEQGAPAPVERMATARRLKQQGWRVRIRLDPIIRGFEYAPIIEELRRLAPERVTLGALRVEANLRDRIPRELVEQLEPAPQPKAYARYPVPERLAMYRAANDVLRSVCPVGLCEETPEIWDALALDKEAFCCNCGK